MERKTISEYRKYLRTVCQDSNLPRCNLEPLKDGSKESGFYRVLGIIKAVQNEDFVRGYCQPCKKIEKIQNFHSSNNGDYHCNQCGKKVMTQLMLTMRIIDDKNCESKVLLKNIELFNFFQFTSPSLQPETIEEEIRKKAVSLVDAICEIGIAKLKGRSTLILCKTLMS